MILAINFIMVLGPWNVMATYTIKPSKFIVGLSVKWNGELS